MWKKSRTVLRLTVYERGAKDHFTGSIDYVDFEEQIVSFVEDATQRFLPALNLLGADFTVKHYRVEIADPRLGKVVLEEVPTV